jgi:hypothetical protein
MPSPQPNTDNIRQLKEEIERLAPQDPAAREERQRLYS